MSLSVVDESHPASSSQLSSSPTSLSRPKQASSTPLDRPSKRHRYNQTESTELPFFPSPATFPFFPTSSSASPSLPLEAKLDHPQTHSRIRPRSQLYSTDSPSVATPFSYTNMSTSASASSSSAPSSSSSATPVGNNHPNESDTSSTKKTTNGLLSTTTTSSPHEISDSITQLVMKGQWSHLLTLLHSPTTSSTHHQQGNLLTSMNVTTSPSQGVNASHFLSSPPPSSSSSSSSFSPPIMNGSSLSPSSSSPARSNAQSMSSSPRLTDSTTNTSSSSPVTYSSSLISHFLITVLQYIELLSSKDTSSALVILQTSLLPLLHHSKHAYTLDSSNNSSSSSTDSTTHSNPLTPLISHIKISPSALTWLLNLLSLSIETLPQYTGLDPPPFTTSRTALATFLQLEMQLLSHPSSPQHHQQHHRDHHNHHQRHHHLPIPPTRYFNALFAIPYARHLLTISPTLFSNIAFQHAQGYTSTSLPRCMDPHTSTSSYSYRLSQSLRPVGCFLASSSDINGMALSRDGTLLATITDNTIKLWLIAAFYPYLFPLIDINTRTFTSPQQRCIAVSKAYSIPLPHIPSYFKHLTYGTLTRISFSECGMYLACDDETTLRIYNIMGLRQRLKAMASVGDLEDHMKTMMPINQRKKGRKTKAEDHHSPTSSTSRKPTPSLGSTSTTSSGSSSSSVPIPTSDEASCDFEALAECCLAIRPHSKTMSLTAFSFVPLYSGFAPSSPDPLPPHTRTFITGGVDRRM